MDPMWIQVLELRFGLTGKPALSLAECGRVFHLTRQRIQQIEQAGIKKLARHQDIRRAFQSGLKAIQGQLWVKMTDKNRGIISNQIVPWKLKQKVGGPESLLVKVCYGDLRKWLKRNLPGMTGGGWTAPLI
jgi:hypothetical protein